MHTRQQIIENQEKYKDEIIYSFLKEIVDIKKELREIDSDDDFIMKEKEKWIKKFKKINTLNSIKKYFLLSNNRDEKFYVWWDLEQQETLILKYG